VNRQTAARFGAAAASGVLLALARPPFGVGALSCVALVPLFVTWRDTTPKRRAALAFEAAVAYYAVLVSWTWYFGAVAIVPLVAALGAYWALIGWGVATLDRLGFRSPWWTAAVWVLGEGVLARWPLGGFSWGEVGYALAGNELARAVASIGGLPLVSFLVVALNGVIADLAVRELRRPRAMARAGAATVAVALVVGVAVAARPELHTGRPLRVAILQGNDKNRDLTAAEKKAEYLTNSHLGLVKDVRDPVDLIIFPESSLSEDPRFDRRTRDALVDVARTHHAWVLGNTVADADGGTHADNLDLLYNPDGKLVGTYSKRHLVPYGERVPFRSFLEKIIPAVDQVPRDFKPGTHAGHFAIAGVDTATIICFESAFGDEVRPLVRDGADVIIVSTNNRSYRRSANSAQHIALGQMRVAETGRPLIHAAISGESAFIDAHGRVHGRTHLFDRTVLQRTVTSTTGTTWYVRFGEWVLLGALAAVAGALVTGLVNRRAAAGRRVEPQPSRSVDSEPA
jgi:apolipoprotein N-acyltransferase